MPTKKVSNAARAADANLNSLSGRERRVSSKAQAIVDAATEKANNKREAALKSAERAEKKTCKKAKTVEITQRRNQENQEPLTVTTPVDRHQDTRAHHQYTRSPSVEQDLSFTVQDIHVSSKASTPRMNLVLQKGAVPRPPLAAASSAGNRASVLTNAKTPASKKLTPAKAHYLLQLREQINSGTPWSADEEFNGTTAAHGEEFIFDDDEDIQQHHARPHHTMYTPDGDDGDNNELEGGLEYGFQNNDMEIGYNNNNINEIEMDYDNEDNNNVDIDDEERPVSPQAGQKRSRCDSDLNPADIGKYRKAIKVKNSRGKPKADDWEPEVQDVLAEAIEAYEIRLASLGFYPDHMQEVTWAKAAWRDGCHECEVKIHHNTELIKILTGRGTHLRGVIKTKACALVETMYGFEVSGEGAVEENRKKVEKLKDGFAFVYRKLGDGDRPNKGLYEHSIIQRLVNQVWFGQKLLSPGVKFSEHFSPFTDVGLAITLAAIENSIDEWGSGTKTDIHFTSATYKSVYEEHLKMLNKFEEHTKQHGILPKILQRLHDNGRIFAKADPLSNNVTRDISASALDAAIREFQNRNGNLSESEGDD